RFAGELVELLSREGSDAEVYLLDERLTTVSAHRALHSSGRKGRTRSQGVDQVAAVMILQQALDSERSTGARAGELVTEAEAAQGGQADDEEDGRARGRPGSTRAARSRRPRTRRARPGPDAAGPPGSTPGCAGRCRCCWSSWCWSVRPSAG